VRDPPGLLVEIDVIVAELIVFAAIEAVRLLVYVPDEAVEEALAPKVREVTSLVTGVLVFLRVRGVASWGGTILQLVPLLRDTAQVSGDSEVALSVWIGFNLNLWSILEHCTDEGADSCLRQFPVASRIARDMV